MASHTYPPDCEMVSLTYSPDGGHDSQVSVRRERRQREYCHSYRDVSHKFAKLALEVAIGPGLDSVDGGDEGHGEEEHQKVTQRQRDDVGVGDVAQVSVAHEDQDESSVTCPGRDTA